ncbi:MAG: hypothetical protein ACI4SN_00030 [Lachnospiraceae bacterium]
MKIVIDNVEITFDLRDHSFSYPATTTLEQISHFFDDPDFNLLRDFTFAHFNRINGIADYEHNYSELLNKCSERFPDYVYGG